MRMTAHKKEILTYFEPDNLKWVTGEIGAPPLDVSGVAYLLHGMASFDKRHQLESTRRTLEAMVRDGLLEKMTSYEQRQDTTQSGAGKGVWCNCSRYGLPGSTVLLRDTGGNAVIAIVVDAIKQGIDNGRVIADRINEAGYQTVAGKAWDKDVYSYWKRKGKHFAAVTAAL